ncbi:hypothetical protein HanIR_Chr09g0396041 [Helianthus annuus]|nr:hypothetical protein HanIR_Chr09g0396041 [Helianthus annuus]
MMMLIARCYAIQIPMVCVFYNLFNYNVCLLFNDFITGCEQANTFGFGLGSYKKLCRIGWDRLS